MLVDYLEEKNIGRRPNAWTPVSVEFDEDRLLQNEYELLATHSYAIADAMMQERHKRTSEQPGG